MDYQEIFEKNLKQAIADRDWIAVEALFLLYGYRLEFNNGT